MATVQVRSDHLPAIRRVAPVLALVAASLVVASALHLSGHVHGRSTLFDSDDAGVAEAIIAAVLAGGLVAMRRFPARARAVGIGVTSFAVAGFLVGLSITLGGGHLPDIAYHLVVLPVLITSLIALLRH